MYRDELASYLDKRKNDQVKVSVGNYLCGVDALVYTPQTDVIALTLNHDDEKAALALALGFDKRLRLEFEGARRKLVRVGYDNDADEIVFWLAEQ